MKIAPQPVKQLRGEIQIPISDLRVGMFVSKPDCGWDKTPFMLQGFLIRNSKEISTLKKFARQVVVDPRRSQLKSFENKYLTQIYEDIPSPKWQFKRAESRNAIASHGMQPASRKKWRIDWRLIFRKNNPERSPSPVNKTNINPDKSINQIIATEPDVPFKEYVLSMYTGRTADRNGGSLFEAFSERIRSLIGFSGTADRRSGKIQSVPRKAKPSFVPDDVHLVIYPEPEPTYVSLPKARAACDHLEKTLKRIVNEISIRGLSNVETLREAADTVVDNMIARPDTMIWIAKMRAYSDARYQQALSVAIHLTALGRQIGFQREQLADLAGIGLLLDVGKVTINPSLLNKPGRLTGPEIEIVRTHVQQGLKMFGESGNLPEIMIRAIAEHHERVDGAGYPNGLSGKNISIYGKMAAIADCFVAMVNPRPYAPTYTAYDAIRQLFRESDSRWFRPLVEQFVQSIGIFPVGSLIELSTGEIAIVVQHNRIRRMEPKVLVVTSKSKLILDHPWDLDILKHNQNAINSEIRILKGVADGAYGIDFHKYYLNAK